MNDIEKELILAAKEAALVITEIGIAAGLPISKNEVAARVIRAVTAFERSIDEPEHMMGT